VIRRAVHQGPGRYAEWVASLAALLRPGARVLDLGCGNGIPATRALCDLGLQVIGVDFSAVQLGRARRLVPAAALPLVAGSGRADPGVGPVRPGGGQRAQPDPGPGVRCNVRACTS